MLSDFSVIEGEYLHDILDQPRALNQTLIGLDLPKRLQKLAGRLQKGKFRNVVLTGMGSSFHALHPLSLELINQGFTVVMVETSELIHYQRRLFDPGNLVVAVSQSGQSAEVIRLLKSNRSRSPIIAITNAPESALAKNAEAVVLTQAGKEFSVSCKTYLASLTALRWLGDIICERDLRRTRRELGAACPLVEAYLMGWRDHVNQLALRLKNTRQLFLVGRGSSLAAVETGALIVKEADHFPAEGMSSAAFRHGPLEMLGGETFVLVFAGDSTTLALNRGLFLDIRQEEGQTEWIGEDSTFPAFALPQVPNALRPILEILPVQMITIALAAKVGREAGRFAVCSKITTKE